MGATVGPTVLKIARSKFLVVVLPFEPVMPITLMLPALRTLASTADASLASARTTSLTKIWGWSAAASTKRSTTAATAPALAALATNKCPSVISPGLAKNRDPGPTNLESVSTEPVTIASALPDTSCPPMACATSARVSSIMTNRALSKLRGLRV